MLLKATFQQPLHICFLLAQPWFLQPYYSDLACTLAEVGGSLLGTCQVAELIGVTDFLEFGRAEQPSWGIGLVQALQSPDPQSALLGLPGPGELTPAWLLPGQGTNTWPQCLTHIPVLVRRDLTFSLYL